MTTKRIKHLYDICGAEVREPEKDVDIEIKLSDLYRAMAVTHEVAYAIKPARRLIDDEFEFIFSTLAAILSDNDDDFYDVTKKILIKANFDSKKDAFGEFLRDLVDGLQEDEDE